MLLWSGGARNHFCALLISMLAVGTRWEDFESLVTEKESKMLRAFTSMDLDPAGQLRLAQMKGKPLQRERHCCVLTVIKRLFLPGSVQPHTAPHACAFLQTSPKP